MMSYVTMMSSRFLAYPFLWINSSPLFFEIFNYSFLSTLIGHKFLNGNVLVLVAMVKWNIFIVTIISSFSQKILNMFYMYM